MIGNSYMYKTKLYFFEDVKEYGAGQVVLHTDRSKFEFNDEGEVVKFLQEALPVDNKPAKQRPSIQPAMSNDVANQLQQVLMDNIERIQNDKDYIPQAMAISKQVNTLISLTNLEAKLKGLK